ncbi:MAG: hypothetical protein MMC33_000617 [Icmadophila ericetorum]|nr:hypothetical protein [Icmadophila ericetorum]
MHSFTLAATALLAVVASASPLSRRQTGAAGTDSKEGNTTFIQQLESAATVVDRLALLEASDMVYDFGKASGNASNTVGNGGHTVKSDRKVFPALVGTGVAMTVGFLGPCGFNTPHTHPRSSEINIVVQGQLVTEFTMENGAKTINNNLTQYQMTVFPQGAIHTEFNPDCTNAVFVAGFGSEDPGVQQTAQTFFGLNPQLVEAVIGGDGTVDGQDVAAFVNVIPKNVALGVKSCLAKCKIPARK